MKTLREWRAERLESSKTLATKAGVSNKTILGIENGRNLPTFRTIRRLSGALDVAPADIAEFAAAIEERGKDAARTSHAASGKRLSPVGGSETRER